MSLARLPSLMLAALLLFLAGCGGGSEKTEEYESLLTEIVAKADTLTTEFETIKDRRTAGQAVENILRISNELSRLISQAGELPSLGPLDGLHMKKRYEEHWQEQLKETFGEVEKAAQAAAGKSGGHRGMLRVDTRMQQLRQQLVDFEKGFREAS